MLKSHRAEEPVSISIGKVCSPKVMFIKLVLAPEGPEPVTRETSPGLGPLKVFTE